MRVVVDLNRCHDTYSVLSSPTTPPSRPTLYWPRWGRATTWNGWRAPGWRRRRSSWSTARRTLTRNGSPTPMRLTSNAPTTSTSATARASAYASALHSQDWRFSPRSASSSAETRDSSRTHRRTATTRSSAARATSWSTSTESATDPTCVKGRSQGHSPHRGCGDERIEQDERRKRRGGDVVAECPDQVAANRTKGAASKLDRIRYDGEALISGPRRCRRRLPRGCSGWRSSGRRWVSSGRCFGRIRTPASISNLRSSRSSEQATVRTRSASSAPGLGVLLVGPADGLLRRQPPRAQVLADRGQPQHDAVPHLDQLGHRLGGPPPGRSARTPLGCVRLPRVAACAAALSVQMPSVQTSSAVASANWVVCLV